MATELASQANVLKLPVPDEGEALYFDSHKTDRVKGLALRVRAAGSRTWMFYYRFGGSQRRIRIGDANAMELDAARRKARQCRVALDGGQDPTVEKLSKRVAAGLTFAKVIEQYLGVRATDMKPRALVEVTRHLKEAWKPLHGLPLASIARPVIATRLRELTTQSGPIGTNRARGTLSAMFAWAIGEGLCESNPVEGTNKNKERTRDRVLTDAELAKVWLAAPDNSYGRIVKLLMLTGQRRDEIGSLHWSEIEHADDPKKAQIALPKERTKNGRAHDVPLSSPALAILEAQHRIIGRDLVFGEGEGGYSGWSKAKEALDAACKVKNWTLHDMRRTAATRMADIGIQPHVIEAVINHVSGHKAGVAGIYNRSSYAAEKRAALNEWASHLQVEIAKAEGSNVTALKPKKAKA
jgi:integrase